MITQQSHQRFKDAPWYSPNVRHSVMVGGSGGIGTWLSVLLSRANFPPIVFDYDRVEEHNIGGQFFRTTDIGKLKVDALSDIIGDFTGDMITTFGERITQESPVHHIMFSAFDNMKARRDLFEVWKKSLTMDSEYIIPPIYIDGRLSMEQLQIFCVTPDKIEQYEENLFEDSEIPDAPCTMKQTSHSAAMIASHMVAFLTNHVANATTGSSSRYVPFYYEYFIPMVLTNIE